MTAEELGKLDFDYVCCDMQHGLIGYKDAVEMLRALDRPVSSGNTVPSGNSTPFARVPWNQHGVIGKVMDAGAVGVIIPMVNSSAEAVAAVKACYYPPEGERSHAFTRGVVGRSTQQINESAICAPMVETATAVDAVEDIAKVKGVDAVYVGPSDLSLSLGLPPGNNDGEPAFDEALRTVVSVCKRQGIIAGIQANPTLAEKRLEMGFQLVTVAVDNVELTKAMRSALKNCRP